MLSAIASPLMLMPMRAPKLTTRHFFKNAFGLHTYLSVAKVKQCASMCFDLLGGGVEYAPKYIMQWCVIALFCCKIRNKP